MIRTAAGCASGSLFYALLVADDENGNLSDGTPHAQQIIEAFQDHEIHCNQFFNIANNCPDIQGVDFQVSTGNNLAYLTWDPVINAQKYSIYRNDINPTMAPMEIGVVYDTSFIDEDVSNGHTHYYQILPLGESSACTGRLSARKSAIPTPNLLILPEKLESWENGSLSRKQLDAYGGSTFFEWSSPDLPSWLHLDTDTGLLHGIPNADGAYTFTVNVVDLNKTALTGSRTYTLYVVTPGAMTIRDTEFAPWIINGYHEEEISVSDECATGWNEPLSCNYVVFTSSIIEGSLPEGLYLRNTNPDDGVFKIAGVPGEGTKGIYRICLQVEKLLYGVPNDARQMEFEIIVLNNDQDIVVTPSEGTTAGGTILDAYFDSLWPLYSVKFSYNHSDCTQAGECLNAESWQKVGSYHYSIVSPPSIAEETTDIKFSFGTNGIIKRTAVNAYTYKALAYTANQVTQDVSIVDTVENRLFSVQSSVDFPEALVPRGLALVKGANPGRQFVLVSGDGKLEVWDGANFGRESHIKVYGGLLPNADDVAVDSDGVYAYIVRPFQCTGLGTGPHPGGIAVVDLATGMVVDVDGNPETASGCIAPEHGVGMSEIEINNFYPVSAETLRLEKPSGQFAYGEPYPGEYLFVSGTFSEPDIQPCLPGEICPPPGFSVKKMGVAVIDINPWIYVGIQEGHSAIAPNPNRWQMINFLVDGPDGEDIYSDHPLDFVIQEEGVMPLGGRAFVYVMNAYAQKAYVLQWTWPTLDYYRNPDGTPVTIPISSSATDVKVQGTNLGGGPWTTLAYITNAEDDTVTVIDTATNTEISPGSPIGLGDCAPSDPLERYPTSYDTRSDGSRGYTADFHSVTTSGHGTVTSIDLPTSDITTSMSCKIEVGEAPIRIVVQPVPDGTQFFQTVRNALAFAEPDQFTTPSKQSNLIRDWEDVHQLAETSANPEAVVSNIDAFSGKVDRWIVDPALKETVTRGVTLYRARYIYENPLPGNSNNQ